MYTKDKVEDFLDNYEEGAVVMGNMNILPSQFQPYDEVSVNFYNAGFINLARVRKVHFTHNKVSYDLEICTNVSNEGKENNIYTRIYNVDSVYVKPRVN